MGIIDGICFYLTIILKPRWWFVTKISTRLGENRFWILDFPLKKEAKQIYCDKLEYKNKKPSRYTFYKIQQDHIINMKQ